MLMNSLRRTLDAQEERNRSLLAATPFVGARFESTVLPLRLNLTAGRLEDHEAVLLAAIEKQAAAIAIRSLASLAKAGDIDHLGGGLELIPSLLMTLAVADYDKIHFTIEHAHTSIGYYAALAALGFLNEDRVVNTFRRGLDIAGHVSWAPGGAELNGGRLGVMVPVAVGQALGLKAHKGAGAAVICHCGDAGWISGQALGGFVAASLHHAPVVFVMHRNGIQLSGTTERIMNKDPRPIIASLGVRILEIPSLHDRAALWAAYAEAYGLAQSGQPALIFPIGYRSTESHKVTLGSFGEMYGVGDELAHFAAKHEVPLTKEVWIPGSLMSFRDVHAMIECLFLVNRLPGGEGHHDGGMKGRDAAAVLANPMLKLNAGETAALDRIRKQPPRVVVTTARPARGTANLVLNPSDVADVQLPGVDKVVSPRAGSEAAYVAVAKKYPDRCFFVSCDLDPSTKIGAAAKLVPASHRFEMSIQEQAASLLTNGLSFSSREPQINVFGTFMAFLEGIAREGFELWRYQRNLTGANEGLNVILHCSHVGACTGRDHFSGWGLDWINFGLGYLPYLRRFYAPADARAAFIAVRDAASAYGGHLVAVPRDNLPILSKQGSAEPLWNATDDWSPVTVARQVAGARSAIVALGAPSYIACQAADAAAAKGVATDVYIVNGFPTAADFVERLARQYHRLATIEDGLIGTAESGLRGLAGFVASGVAGSQVELAHFGITNPQVAPSEHYVEVWKHFGITEAALLDTLTS